MNKKQAQFLHCKKRFKEHHGIELTPTMNAGIIKQIKNNTAMCIEMQSKRVIIYDVIWRSKVYRVVYDKKRGGLISTLKTEYEKKCGICGELMGSVEHSQILFFHPLTKKKVWMHSRCFNSMLEDLESESPDSNKYSNALEEFFYRMIRRR